MRILWKKHPSDPSKNGQTEHVSRTLAEIAVGYSQAEYAPYKSYVDRLSEESKFRTAEHAAAAGDTIVEFFQEPKWVVKQLVDRLVILKYHGYSVYRFEKYEDAKANGCPVGTLNYFSELEALPGPEQVRARMERLKQEQTNRELQENTAKYKVLA